MVGALCQTGTGQRFCLGGRRNCIHSCTLTQLRCIEIRIRNVHLNIHIFRCNREISDDFRIFFRLVCNLQRIGLVTKSSSIPCDFAILIGNFRIFIGHHCGFARTGNNFFIHCILCIKILWELIYGNIRAAGFPVCICYRSSCFRDNREFDIRNIHGINTLAGIEGQGIDCLAYSFPIPCNINTTPDIFDMGHAIGFTIGCVDSRCVNGLRRKRKLRIQKIDFILAPASADFKIILAADINGFFLCLNCAKAEAAILIYRDFLIICRCLTQDIICIGICLEQGCLTGVCIGRSLSAVGGCDIIAGLICYLCQILQRFLADFNRIGYTGDF